MSRAWFLPLFALLLGWSGAAAAAGARPIIYLNQLDISQPPAVRVYLTDLDSSLSPITDRKPQHYRLLIDGVPQTGADRLQRLHQLREAVALTLVVQVSPALRESLTDAVDASKRLIDALPAGSRVGLIAYTDVVVQDLKPSPPGAAKEAVDSLRVKEDALEVQLPDAIKDALEGMDNPSLPRQRMLVVLSDGLTTDLNLTVFSELGRRAQDKGIVIHAIGVAPLEPARLRTLHELCKRGGGTMREAKDASGVTQAFAALQEEIRNQLVLTYQAPSFFDGKLHDFQIETPGGQASNIVPIELPKVTPKDAEAKAWYRSTWFLVSMLVVGQVGLVLLVVLAFRWRRKPRVMLRDRYARDDEDEEEEEEEPEDSEEDEQDEEQDGEPRAEPPRPEPRPRSQRGGRIPAERSANRSVKENGRGPSRRGGLALNVDDEDDGPVAGERSTSRRNLESLLQPNPLLFDTQPEPGSGGADADTAEKKPVASPPHGSPTMMHPDLERGRGEPSQSVRGGEPRGAGPQQGYAMLLPDPQAFLSSGRSDPPASAPRPTEAASGPIGARGPASSGPEAMALPDPEEFMRQVRGPELSGSRSGRGEAAPGQPGRPEPSSSGRADRQPALARAEQSAVRVPSPAVMGSGIPLQSPAVVPAALPPEAGVEPGRFLDRKTKVIAIEELNAADYVAWVVPLGGPPHPAVVVNDGFSIGSDGGCDLRLQGPDVLPRHGVLRLDSRGFRVETSGAGGSLYSQPLSDGDRFLIGSYEFVFKVAARTSTEPLAAARLEVLDGMDQGRRVALPENEVVTMGSHSSCTLVVRGDGVEKCHAIAVRNGQICTISDLGSATGIGYQGQAIGYRKIRSWEEVLIGTVRVIFILEDFGAQESEEYGDEQAFKNPRIPE